MAAISTFRSIIELNAWQTGATIYVYNEMRIPAELQQARLVPMQFQSELLEPLAQCFPESPRIGFVFKADNQIIGIAHEDHFAFGLSSPPLLVPQVEYVVQVDIGKQWRNHCTLRCPLLTDAPVPIFQNAHLEPLAHKKNDALIANPMLQESDQP
jgi:hypothetical protein